MCALTDVDTRWMRRALEHARRGLGRTTPNPVVGASVVTPEGIVVGDGAHERAGEAHAEIHALDEAGARAHGATLYCTLEPCAHTGRTGPCTERIIAAGIARVVAALQDPDPRVQGRGFARLRDHGVTVDIGVERAAAARLNQPYLTAMTLGRPFVILKAATSLDGRIAARSGDAHAAHVSRGAPSRARRAGGGRRRGGGVADSSGGRSAADRPRGLPRTSPDARRVRPAGARVCHVAPVFDAAGGTGHNGDRR